MRSSNPDLRGLDRVSIALDGLRDLHKELNARRIDASARDHVEGVSRRPSSLSRYKDADE